MSPRVLLVRQKGEPIYDALVDAVKLRYTLLPYIYSTSWDVTHNRSTFMRALFMDFVNDKQTWNVNDEYMFGKAFLVAPVLHAQYTPEVQQKTLEEMKVGTVIPRNQPKHLYLLTLPIPRTWKSICLPVPGGITSGLMKP